MNEAFCMMRICVIGNEWVKQNACVNPEMILTDLELTCILSLLITTSNSDIAAPYDASEVKELHIVDFVLEPKRLLD